MRGKIISMFSLRLALAFLVAAMAILGQGSPADEKAEQQTILQIIQKMGQPDALFAPEWIGASFGGTEPKDAPEVLIVMGYKEAKKLVFIGRTGHTVAILPDKGAVYPGDRGVPPPQNEKAKPKRLSLSELTQKMGLPAKLFRLQDVEHRIVASLPGRPAEVVVVMSYEKEKKLALLDMQGRVIAIMDDNGPK